jgi:hypothetical protein
MTTSKQYQCVFCGLECSQRPHVRNRRGQYACKGCLPEPEVTPLEVTPVDLSHVHRAPCPKCGAEQKVGVPECPECGHAPPRDPGSPRLPKPKLGPGAKPRTCRKCSYPLEGLKQPTCPECGTPFSLFTRREWDEATSDEVARNAYLKAACIAAGGVLLGVCVQLLMGRWIAAAGFPVFWLVSSGIGLAVALASCATWLGFSSSIKLMAVQIGAIHGATLGVMALFASIIPSLIGAIIVSGFIYIYLMSEMLDIDPFDARIVGFICLALHWIGLMFAKLQGWI